MTTQLTNVEDSIKYSELIKKYTLFLTTLSKRILRLAFPVKNTRNHISSTSRHWQERGEETNEMWDDFNYIFNNIQLCLRIIIIFRSLLLTVLAIKLTTLSCFPNLILPDHSMAVLIFGIFFCGGGPPRL